MSSLIGRRVQTAAYARHHIIICTDEINIDQFQIFVLAVAVQEDIRPFYHFGKCPVAPEEITAVGICHQMQYECLMSVVADTGAPRITCSGSSGKCSKSIAGHLQITA